MPEARSFDNAMGILKAVHRRTVAGDEDLDEEFGSIVVAQDEVLARYQELFRPENLSDLSEGAFREFLHFKNNRHWMSLQRMGPAIGENMERLREAGAACMSFTFLSRAGSSMHGYGNP